MRREALQSAARSEGWKYTPTAPLDRAWRKAPVSEADRDLLPPPLPGFLRLVSVNGRFPEEAHPCVERLRSPGEADAEGKDGFSLLNRALFEEASRIVIPAGEDGGLLELVHLVADADEAMVHPRVVVHLGEGATLTLVERFVGPSDSVHFVNAQTRVTQEAGSHLVHCVLQEDGPKALHVGKTRVHVGAGARFWGHVVHTGAALARRVLEVGFEGPDAHATLDALLRTRTGQHHDQEVHMNHAQPGCTSRQRVRALGEGTGRCVFTARTRVDATARCTDAGQSLRALLLSREAEVDFRPHLEIHTDEVKATHGAAVGEIDPEQLFYLRARGIPEALARTVLTVAFAREVVDVLPSPALREQVLAAIEGA